MSTILYLHCITHEPHIGSGEVGSHLGHLEKVRKVIATRDEIVELWERSRELDLFEPDSGDSYVNNMGRFLVQHPHCALAIFDEYGVEYPIVEPPKLDDPTLIVLQWVATIPEPHHHDHIVTSMPRDIIETAQKALKNREKK